MIKRDYIYYAMTLVFLIMLVMDFTPWVNPLDHIYGDAVQYRAMAMGDTTNVVAPFAYRILVPGIVNLFVRMGAEPEGVFFIITFLSLLLTAWLFPHVCRLFGMCNGWEFLPGWLFLATFWLTAFNLSDFWLVDPLANLLILAGVYCVVKAKRDSRWNFAMAAVCMVGALCKETIILVPIFAFFYRRWQDALGLSIITLLALYLIRCAIEPAGVYASIQNYTMYGTVKYTWLTFSFLWLPLAWVAASNPKAGWKVALLAIVALAARSNVTDVSRVVATVFFFPVFVWGIKGLQLLGDYYSAVSKIFPIFVPLSQVCIFALYLWIQLSTKWI
jgi:hypothetical protein